MALPRKMRPPGAFSNNAAYREFLRQCSEHDLSLMTVWEARSPDSRTAGPNLRKFALYHGADRVLAGMLIVEGFGPDGIAVWGLQTTANPEAGLHALELWAKARRTMADRKRETFGKYAGPVEEEPEEDDSADA